MVDRLSGDRALDRLRTVSDEIVDRVTKVLPAWVRREVGRIADAWAGTGGTIEGWDMAADDAASAVASRVGGELRTLFSSEPEAMTRTPLEVVRSAVVEPTAVLVALGVPPIDRDEFATRSWPDDRYGLTPATLADLGDPDLGPLLLAWGMAKASALRGDHER